MLSLLAAAACGGGGEPTPTPTVTVPGGVNTSLPRHLTKVEPAAKSTVSNADLHIGEANATGGICATFDFTVADGMGDKPTDRVALFVNQENVTNSSTWQVTASQPPTSGTICYAAPQPFDEGEQLASVRYTEATERQFIYNWTFTVSNAAPRPTPVSATP
jgi:hypothetical protein